MNRIENQKSKRVEAWWIVPRLFVKKTYTCINSNLIPCMHSSEEMWNRNEINVKTKNKKSKPVGNLTFLVITQLKVVLFMVPVCSLIRSFPGGFLLPQHCMLFTTFNY